MKSYNITFATVKLWEQEFMKRQEPAVRKLKEPILDDIASALIWHHGLNFTSFVSEHIETLEEIDVEYKELALESGIEKWGRVPTLGCEPTFISDLANAVIESLPYVGAMATSSNLEARHSLVPLGSVEELLVAYDSQRRELPPPVIVWEWGWRRSAETWNGRVAMLAVLLLLFYEVTADKGVLHQLGI